MNDCQWGVTLHAHGLLRAGFVPPTHIRRLQDYLRLRTNRISLATSHVQHIQKALERMSIKLHTVISSLTGISGLAMVRAILAGERADDVNGLPARGIGLPGARAKTACAPYSRTFPVESIRMRSTSLEPTRSPSKLIRKPPRLRLRSVSIALRSLARVGSLPALRRASA